MHAAGRNANLRVRRRTKLKRGRRRPKFFPRIRPPGGPQVTSDNLPAPGTASLPGLGGARLINPLCRKLENYKQLRPEDQEALAQASLAVHQIGARETIIEEGDRPGVVNLILDGWACRYKQFEDGRRQIISFLLPGDMCDPYVFLFRAMDQSIGTLTPVRYARIPQDTIRALTARSDDLAEALWWDMMVTAEIQREWTVSLGRRTATERLAHLFCELAVRLQMVGLANGRDCEVPVTQGDLGDAVGLSTVHVNRTLQELRSLGLISLRGRHLSILDENGLRRLAFFNPSYLHVRRDPAREMLGVRT